MVYENDKFKIPKRYLRMSASKLERLADKEYERMKKKNSKRKNKSNKLAESPVKVQSFTAKP